MPSRPPSSPRREPNLRSQIRSSARTWRSAPRGCTESASPWMWPERSSFWHRLQHLSSPAIRSSSMAGGRRASASTPMDERGVRTELAENSIGLLGVLMQGIATIAPAFAIVSTFVFTVGLAGLAAPLAYLLAGASLLPVAVSVNQLAKAFPSAGGWYTWIARSLHPRAGFFAGWYMTLWLPFAPAPLFSFLATTVLTPVVRAEYGVTVPVWVWTTAGPGLFASPPHQGVPLSATATPLSRPPLP